MDISASEVSTWITNIGKGALKNMKEKTKKDSEDKKISDVKEKKIGASSVEHKTQNEEGKEASVHEN